MLEKYYPILEYDEATEPLLNAEDTVDKGIKLAEKCVISFFADAISSVLERYPNKKITQMRNEGYPIPVIEVEYKGEKINLVQALVGGPGAAIQLEELTAMGCKKYICCGSCGALSDSLALGDIVIPTSAVRDEGTSYHYASANVEAIADTKITRIIEATLVEADIPFIKGRTWTTDALYRETPYKIQKRIEEGCITVDMEASTYMIVAKHKNVEFGQLLYAGDSLSGEEWDYRGYLDNYMVRELLLLLSMDACVKL